MYLKMLLGLSGVHRHGQAIRSWWGIQSWVLVQVGQQQRGTDRWPIVQTRTSVTVSAGSARRCKRCQYVVMDSDHRQGLCNHRGVQLELRPEGQHQDTLHAIALLKVSSVITHLRRFGKRLLMRRLPLHNFKKAARLQALA